MIACNVNEDSHNGRSISWKPFLISSARLKQTKMHYRLYTISSNRGWLYGNHKLSGSSNVTWIMGWRSFDVIFDFNTLWTCYCTGHVFGKHANLVPRVRLSFSQLTKKKSGLGGRDWPPIEWSCSVHVIDFLFFCKGHCLWWKLDCNQGRHLKM